MGLTKAELAEALGVNLATVYRLEAGTTRVTKRTALAIEALAKARRTKVVLADQPRPASERAA